MLSYTIEYAYYSQISASAVFTAILLIFADQHAEGYHNMLGRNVSQKLQRYVVIQLRLKYITDLWTVPYLFLVKKYYNGKMSKVTLCTYLRKREVNLNW